MLLAATLVTLAWAPAARADDSDLQPSNRRGSSRTLRRTALPPDSTIGIDVVSSGARATVATGRRSNQQDPLGRFNWGNLGLSDDPPSEVRPAQALLPANDVEAKTGDAPAQPIATLLRELPAPLADGQLADGPLAEGPLPEAGAAPEGERLAQRPTGPNVAPFEEAFNQGQQSLEVNCDTERQKLRPINAVTNKITAEPGAFPPECGIGDLTYKTRDFSPMTYTWVASNLCHKPLYFEQPRLERYGHALPPVIQPLVSAAHFFISVPLLPYKMGIEPPNECIYALGYYRPSSCAPMQIPGVPLSLRGAIYEAAVITGFAVVLPP